MGRASGAPTPNSCWVQCRLIGCGTPGRTGVRRAASRDQFIHDAPVHVGEAEIAACVAESELFVVESEQPENGGVQVMHVDLVFDGLKTKFVRGAVNVAAPHTAARHPHREAVMVVVASVYFAGIG